jgi:hypothetical protein
MATILTYRNEGEMPFCEIALDDGAHVQLQLNKSGLIIERQARDERPAEILFKADPFLVSDLCAALLGSVRAVNTTPLDILVPVVMQMRSAGDVRDAFRAASKGL